MRYRSIPRSPRWGLAGGRLAGRSSGTDMKARHRRGRETHSALSILAPRADIAFPLWRIRPDNVRHRSPLRMKLQYQEYCTKSVMSSYFAGCFCQFHCCPVPGMSWGRNRARSFPSHQCMLVVSLPLPEGAGGPRVRVGGNTGVHHSATLFVRSYPNLEVRAVGGFSSSGNS